MKEDNISKKAHSTRERLLGSARLGRLPFLTWFQLYPDKPGGRINTYWIPAGLALSLASILCFLVTDNVLFIVTFLPMALGGALIVLVSRGVYRTLVSWEGQMLSFIADKRYSEIAIKRWFRSHFRNGTRFWPPFVSGIIFVLVSFLVWGGSGIFAGLERIPSTVAAATLLFTSFLVGVVLSLLYYLARLVIGLGDFNIVVSSHSYGVLSVGHVLVSVYVRASLVWFTIALSGVFIFKAMPLPMAILGLPTFLFVVGSFVFIQFPLHRQMKEYKKQELRKLDAALRTLAPYPIEDCTPERLEQIKFYRELAGSISSLPDWPYHWKSAAGVTLTSALAASPSILSLAVDAGKLRAFFGPQ